MWKTLIKLSTIAVVLLMIINITTASQIEKIRESLKAAELDMEKILREQVYKKVVEKLKTNDPETVEWFRKLRTKDPKAYEAFMEELRTKNPGVYKKIKPIMEGTGTEKKEPSQGVLIIKEKEPPRPPPTLEELKIQEAAAKTLRPDYTLKPREPPKPSTEPFLELATKKEIDELRQTITTLLDIRLGNLETRLRNIEQITSK